MCSVLYVTINSLYAQSTLSACQACVVSVIDCLISCLFTYCSSHNWPLPLFSIDNKTKQVVAIKVIDLEEAEDEIEDIQQEITILSQCDSLHVTRYYGSYLKVSVPTQSLDIHVTLCH